MEILSGIKRLAHGTVPTIFIQHTVHRGPSQREKRSNERRKRDGSEDIIEVLPAKIFRVSTDIALKDHDYILRETEFIEIRLSKKKTICGCTDLQPMDDMIKIYRY